MNNDNFWTDANVADFATGFAIGVKLENKELHPYDAMQKFKESKKAVPEYEILSVYHKERRHIEEAMDKCAEPNEHWAIHSVKRNSDGSVFTVGDIVDTWKHNGYPPSQKIKKFFLNEGLLYIQWEQGKGCNDGCMTLNAIQKVKEPIVLFTTEDGIKIYEGDCFFTLNLCSWVIVSDWKYQDLTGFNLEKNYKYFSTKEAAETFVWKHKELLSFREVMDAVYSIVDRGSDHHLGKYLEIITKKKLTIK